ncbi:MAG TPA: TetR/AcrR family transcriptional regulator [Sporichthyaceae bacterium]|nr:TetR/AcrR family transcriptional regulator [Sporichthyaceae bacterium]
MAAAAAVPGRGDVREQAILAATYDLLAVVGYERLTMDAVAEHAHASKTTIYRRWPNKAAMVVAAFAAMDPPPTTELDTGGLRGDLLALVRAVRERFTGANLPRMSSLMFAMQSDPELAMALRAYFLPIRAALTCDLLDRADARGEIPAGLDPAPLRDLTVGALLTRVLVTGEPVDDAYLDALVDGVLLPMLSAPRPTN